LCTGTAGRADQLRSMLARMHALDDLPVLAAEDAAVLELRSMGYLERSNGCNHNARSLADWLQQQPAVQRVYYPGLVTRQTDDIDDDVFAAVARQKPLSFEPSLLQLLQPSAGQPHTGYHNPGHGCLLSFVLNERVNTQVRYMFVCLSIAATITTASTTVLLLPLLQLLLLSLLLLLLLRLLFLRLRLRVLICLLFVLHVIVVLSLQSSSLTICLSTKGLAWALTSHSVIITPNII